MDADKQHKNSFDWLKEYSWQKGQSGNPNGRPKTRTLKEFAREYLANMSEEGRIEYFKNLNPKDVWAMAEGNPETKTDLTSKGEAINLTFVNYGDSKPVVSTETIPSTSA